MAQVIEVPGMGNVEFPDDMNESDIANAIDNQMSQQANANAPVAKTGLAAIAPVAETTAGTGPGLTNVARGVGQAIYETGPGPAVGAVKNYFSHPVANLGIDLASHALGSPVPPMATAATLPYIKSVGEKYKQAMNYARDISPAAEQAIKDNFNYLDTMATPGEMRTIKSQIHTGNLSKFTVPERLAGTPEATAFEQAVRSAAPSFGSKLATTLAPIARTAARVAGPAGMAYNLYQGGEMARQTQLGQRLAEGQSQIAPQSAQNMQLNTNTSGYRPTAQEAANLLQSGDQRTQAIYGGVQRLQQLKQQQDAQANAVLSQPPTAQNFMARMQALAHKYGTAMPNL